MLKKLLNLKVILIVLLILSWVATGVFFYMYKGDVDSQLAAKDSEIASLNDSLTAIGELVPAYTVGADVPSGKKIEETDLVQIDVPVSMATNLVQDMEELVGKHFRLNMTAGSVLTTDCVYEEVITPDMRYYDVIVDQLPIGLQPGDFVDIRIKFGTGADFVGISHRQVAEINGNVLKLILTEEDIHVYSDMTVDNIVYNEAFTSPEDLDKDGKLNDKIDAVGSIMYAVEYVEGGNQEKASNYYAPSSLVQGIMAGDPNLSERKLSETDLVLRRKMIEAGLGDAASRNTASKVRDVITNAVKEGKKEYDKRVEAELKAAQEAGM